MNFVTNLECSYTGKSYPAGQVHELSDDGKPLLVRYDLDRLAKTITKQHIYDSKENGFWRYAPFLPVTKEENRISLGQPAQPTSC